MTAYYADVTLGNDSYDGLSPTYVSGTTGPKATLVAAITAASADDTIYLLAGTYNTNGANGFSVTKSLTINPYNSATVKLTAGVGGQVLYVNPSGALTLTVGAIEIDAANARSYCVNHSGTSAAHVYNFNGTIFTNPAKAFIQHLPLRP